MRPTRRPCQGFLDAGDRASALVVGVGQAEGVGGRAVAGDLAERSSPPGPWRAPAPRGHHPRPFAEDEAVAVAVERPAGAGGLVVAGRERGEEVEAGHAEGVDHAVGAAREHDVGVPRRMISVASPIACELAAQAVRQLAFGPRAPKIPARWPAGRARLLLGLVDRVQFLQTPAGEAGGVDVPVTRTRRGRA